VTDGEAEHRAVLLQEQGVPEPEPVDDLDLLGEVETAVQLPREGPQPTEQSLLLALLVRGEAITCGAPRGGFGSVIRSRRSRDLAVRATRARGLKSNFWYSTRCLGLYGKVTSPWRVTRFSAKNSWLAPIRPWAIFWFW
jgi:hypothetical protein